MKQRFIRNIVITMLLCLIYIVFATLVNRVFLDKGFKFGSIEVVLLIIAIISIIYNYLRIKNYKNDKY